MSNPKISIIVPIYNVEAYLPQCLDSVLAQTFTDFEVICVNDGSPDGCAQILEEYASRDSRIVVMTQDNSGASVARNNALDCAVGEYIMFVDADDWIDAQTCEVAYDTAMQTEADVVMWDYMREFASKSLQKNIFEQEQIFEGGEVRRLHRRIVGMYGSELEKPENADALSTSCAHLYKRDLLQQNNIRFYDIRKTGTFEDGLFNLDVFACARKVVYIPKALYHYRKTNEMSVTTKYKADLQEKHEHIHSYLKNYIAEKSLDAIYEMALSNRIALELVGYGLNILKLPTGRIKAIAEILRNPHYAEAYRQLQTKYMPIHWKVFYICAKLKFTPGIYALLLVIQKLLER